MTQNSNTNPGKLIGVVKMEKRDIHHRKRQYLRSLNSIENDKIIVKRNRELILKFVRDCRLGKTLRKRQKKRIGVARCQKYIDILRKVSFWLDKPFDQVKQEDMERIIEALEDDKYTYAIKGKNGRIIRTHKYAHSTKLDYKKTIKKFYKWLLGNNEYYPELVDWIETYERIMEIPALRREEVEKLADACKVRDKTIIMFLFDSGARVEEALNVRIGNLTKNDDTFRVRIVHSKTKPRTIHLPICSKYLEMWLQEYAEKDENSFLFPVSYPGLLGMLYRVK